MNYNELKRLIGMLKLGNDLTSYAESKLMNFIKEQESKQLPIDVVVKSFICRDCEKHTKEYRDNLCEPCHKWHTDS